MKSTTTKRLDRDARTALERAYHLLNSAQVGRHQVHAAALALEAAGLVDEAVELLMQRSFPEEAAKLLLTRNRGEEAASIYVQLEQWDRAARCLMLANKPQKAAYCSARAGDYTTASQLYEQTGQFDIAIECALRLGNKRRAGGLYRRMGSQEQAREMYEQWLDEAGAETTLDDDETQTLTSILALQSEGSERGIKIARLLEYNSSLKDLVEQARDHADNPPVQTEATELASEVPAPEEASKAEQTERVPVDQSMLASPVTIVMGNSSTPSDPDQQIIFTGSDFLRSFSADERDTLWTLGTIVHFKRGQTIVDYEEHPIGTYTVVDGNVAVYRTANKEKPVDELADGNTFGESWSLLRLRSGVRVVAITDTDVHIVQRQRLNDFLSGDSPLATEIHRKMSRSLIAHIVKRVEDESPYTEREEAA